MMVIGNYTIEHDILYKYFAEAIDHGVAQILSVDHA